MELSARFSAEKPAENAGRRAAVLMDEVFEDGAVGRTVWDAPEADGLVRLRDGLPGALTTAVIASSDDHDLNA